MTTTTTTELMMMTIKTNKLACEKKNIFFSIYNRKYKAIAVYRNVCVCFTLKSIGNFIFVFVFLFEYFLFSVSFIYSILERKRTKSNNYNNKKMCIECSVDIACIKYSMQTCNLPAKMIVKRMHHMKCADKKMNENCTQTNTCDKIECSWIVVTRNSFYVCSTNIQIHAHRTHRVRIEIDVEMVISHNILSWCSERKKKL